MRGEVYELPDSRTARGHEQRGARFGVVVQDSDFDWLSTWLICPTSASAVAASWRPEVTIRNEATRVLTEHARAVDVQRLGRSAGFLSLQEMQAVDRALLLILSLR